VLQQYTSPVQVLLRACTTQLRSPLQQTCFVLAKHVEPVLWTSTVGAAVAATAKERMEATKEVVFILDKSSGSQDS